MVQKTWIIELRTDFDTPEQDEVMLIDVRTKAKELLSNARLLKDKREPDIAIQNDDTYEGREQIEMFTPEEKEEYGIE